MHRKVAPIVRLMLGASLAFAVLAPAQAWAGHGGCVISDTDTADHDGISGVTPETSDPCIDYERGAGSVGKSGGAGDSGGAGIGGVGRIDAGAGATAATGSASLLPWVLLAGAGAMGSVLRRRRRDL